LFDLSRWRQLLGPVLADAEYVADLVNVSCKRAVCDMGMLYLHNDIFLTDIIDCARLKFS